MKEFKTLDDILDIKGKIITRNDYNRLIESEFVDWWEDVTCEYFAPHKENCSTYDMKLKDYDNEYYRLYFFVKN